MAAFAEFEPEGEALALLLRNRADRLAARRPAARNSLHRRPVLAVRAGEERYGLDLPVLSGVLSWRPCARLPETATARIGLAGLHGEIWAVLDLAALMTGETPQAAEGGQLVLLRHVTRRIALRVDRAEEIRWLTEEDLAPHDGRGIAGITADKMAIINPDGLWGHPAFSEGA